MRHGPGPVLLVLLVVLAAAVSAPAARASGASEIASAMAQGKPLFVVVTDANATGTETALEVARQAQALAGNAAVVRLDRGDAQNADVVKAYRVATVPVPMTLVVAGNGVVAGGATVADATAEKLAALVPTPKKAEVLLALTKRVPVFVVASRADMPTRPAVFAELTAAWKTLEERVMTVHVDCADPAEERYLKELAVVTTGPNAATAPVVVVLNVKAQATAVFRGPVTAAQLVEAAKKKMPCCPGGSC